GALGEAQLRTVLRILEPEEHLSRAHAPPFVRRQLDDAASDVGAQLRTVARLHGPRLAVRDRLLDTPPGDYEHGHRHGFRTEEGVSEQEKDRDRDRHDDEPSAPSSHAAILSDRSRQARPAPEGWPRPFISTGIATR